MASGKEKRYLIASLVASLLLGLLGLAIGLQESLHSSAGEVYIDSYKAELGSDGVLVEDYVYVVQATGKRMLFRSWNTPLLLGGEGAQKPYIQALSVECPPGFIAYIYTAEKELAGPITQHPSLYRAVEKILEEEASGGGEAGCYKPGGIEPGEYRVRYVFRLKPVVKCDTSLCFFDLSLASPDMHLYYRSAAILLTGGIVEVETAPSTVEYHAEPIEAGYIVKTGNLPKETGLRLLILASRPYPLEPFSIESVKNAREELRTTYSLLVSSEQIVSLFSIIAGIVAVLAAPFSLIVYLKHGVERKPTSIITGFPPETGEKPWQVNLLYNGEVGSFTKEVVAATLLDLASRGILGLKWSDGETIITLPEDTHDLDDYEKKLVEALRQLSLDGKTVKTSTAKRLIRSKDRRGVIQSYARSLFDALPYKQLYSQAVEDARKLIALALLAVFLAAAASIAYTVAFLVLEDSGLVTKLFVSWMFAVFSYIPPLFTPRYVYGRWRPGYLERFLAWQEFAKKAKQILPGTPLALGNEWLRAAAYLLALGEAEIVEKSLEKLGNELSKAALHATKFFYLYYPRYTGASGGSGGGGGGGFGGGGAGAR